MPLTMLVPNTYTFRPKRTASLCLVYPGIIFLFCLETPSVSLSGNRFITGVDLFLRVVTLFSILLLDAFFYLSTSLFILLWIRGSFTSCSWIKIGWYLLLTPIELNLLLLTLLLTVLLRLVLPFFQVSSTLLLATLFSLKSNLDVNISLRTSFSFFRSFIWFCNNLTFLLCSVVFSFSIQCNISSLGINVLRISLTYPLYSK